MRFEKKIYRYKTPDFLKDVNIEKVLVSNKIYFGGKNYKYFIGYFSIDHKVKPLHIILPKTSANIKSYDGQTKCNTIWDNVIADLKKNDSEPVYNKKFLETKIKSHGDEVTYFYDKKYLRWCLIIAA